jgi:hypothetical protein
MSESFRSAAPQTRMNSRNKAPSGFEPLFQALGPKPRKPCTSQEFTRVTTVMCWPAGCGGGFSRLEAVEPRLPESAADCSCHLPALAGDVELGRVGDALLPVPRLAEELDVAARQRAAAVDPVERHPLVVFREQVFPRDVAVGARTMLAFAHDDREEPRLADACRLGELVSVAEPVLDCMPGQRLPQPAQNDVDLVASLALAPLASGTATIWSGRQACLPTAWPGTEELERPLDTALDAPLPGTTARVVENVRGRQGHSHRNSAGPPTAVSQKART